MFRLKFFTNSKKLSIHVVSTSIGSAVGAIFGSLISQYTSNERLAGTLVGMGLGYLAGSLVGFISSFGQKFLSFINLNRHDQRIQLKEVLISVTHMAGTKKALSIRSQTSVLTVFSVWLAFLAMALLELTHLRPITGPTSYLQPLLAMLIGTIAFIVISRRFTLLTHSRILALVSFSNLIIAVFIAIPMAIFGFYSEDDIEMALTFALFASYAIILSASPFRFLIITFLPCDAIIRRFRTTKAKHISRKRKAILILAGAHFGMVLGILCQRIGLLPSADFMLFACSLTSGALALLTLFWLAGSLKLGAFLLFALIGFFSLSTAGLTLAALIIFWEFHWMMVYFLILSILTVGFSSSIFFDSIVNVLPVEKIKTDRLKVELLQRSQSRSNYDRNQTSSNISISTLDRLVAAPIAIMLLCGATFFLLAGTTEMTNGGVFQFLIAGKFHDAMIAISKIDLYADHYPSVSNIWRSFVLLGISGFLYITLTRFWDLLERKRIKFAQIPFAKTVKSHDAILLRNSNDDLTPLPGRRIPLRKFLFKGDDRYYTFQEFIADNFRPHGELHLLQSRTPIFPPKGGSRYRIESDWRLEIQNALPRAKSLIVIVDDERRKSIFLSEEIAVLNKLSCLVKTAFVMPPQTNQATYRLDWLSNQSATLGKPLSSKCLDHMDPRRLLCCIFLDDMTILIHGNQQNQLAYESAFHLFRLGNDGLLDFQSLNDIRYC